MKTIHLNEGTGRALLLVGGALLVLVLPWMSMASGAAWAGYSTVGAVYVTAQIAREPGRWRSRSGSLPPAICLGAFIWFVAGFATAAAFFQR